MASRLQACALIGANTKGHQHTSMHRQQRNSRQALEGQHARIVGNRAFRLEGGLHALVALVGIHRLADGPDSELGWQPVVHAQGAIDQLLHLELVASLGGQSWWPVLVASLGLAGNLPRVGAGKAALTACSVSSTAAACSGVGTSFKSIVCCILSR